MIDAIKRAWKPIAATIAVMAVVATGLGFAADIGDFVGKHNPFFMRASADGLQKRIEQIDANHKAERKSDRREILTNSTTRLYETLYRAQRERDYLDSTNAPPQRTRSLTEHIHNLQKQYKRANERLEALEK